MDYKNLSARSVLLQRIEGILRRFSLLPMHLREEVVDIFGFSEEELSTNDKDVQQIDLLAQKLSTLLLLPERRNDMSRLYTIYSDIFPPKQIFDDRKLIEAGFVLRLQKDTLSRGGKYYEPVIQFGYRTLMGTRFGPPGHKHTSIIIAKYGDKYHVNDHGVRSAFKTLDDIIEYYLITNDGKDITK